MRPKWQLCSINDIHVYNNMDIPPMAYIHIYIILLCVILKTEDYTMLIDD